MIANFEKITTELTKEEKLLINPLINGFKTHNKKNPVKSNLVVEKMNSYIKTKNLKIKMTGVRLRKCINYIRTNALCPIIGTSAGYYVSNNKTDVEKQIQSLLERAESINNCAKGLQNILRA